MGKSKSDETAIPDPNLPCSPSHKNGHPKSTSDDIVTTQVTSTTSLPFPGFYLLSLKDYRAFASDSRWSLRGTLSSPTGAETSTFLS
jgi:hypothetical protein